jgi:CheY-like chemotaxis protein
MFYIRYMQVESTHIFYTDDDEDDQELFRDALQEVDASLKLTTTDNGDDLLALLSAAPSVPRIIFLDLNMPRRDGYEVLKTLRKDEKWKNDPVVVFSTTSDQAAVDKTREMGANLFVPKPHTYSGMKQAIKTCVNMDWRHFNTSGPDFLMRFN